MKMILPLLLTLVLFFVGGAAVEGHEEGRIVGGNVFRSTDPTTSVEEAYGLAALALGRASS